MTYALDWLPVAEDFRASLREALSIRNPDERLVRLVALSQNRLNFVETIQLDKALSESAREARLEYRTVRLALLSSCTVDHLPAAIRVAGIRRQLNIEVYTGGYGQYRQELLDPSSGLHKFRPNMILLSLTSRAVLGDVPVSITREALDQAISAEISDLASLWNAARDRMGATVIQQSFLDVTEPLFGSHDRLVPGSPSQVVSCLNDQSASAAASEGVLWLDIARSSAREGLDAWFDVRQWLQGKIEIAPQSAPEYGDLAARLIAAQVGQSRKCLVFDLDNTLWGGVIGDDGLEGIALGEGCAVGEAHLALQRYARLLKARGVILAVCSKNEMSIAESAFRDHPEMLLERSDFAAFVANWADKAENLRSIAKHLNIGLDSMVFVDDNPVERARIRESLPMVAVPELPADVSGYVPCVANAGYFEAVSFTEDDQARADQYAANVQREAVRQTAQSMDEFLRGLDMRVDYGPFTPVDLPRITQLFNKTNQFNTTTQRYSQEDVTRFGEDSDAITLHFRLTDRFGDNGLVSAMVLQRVPAEENTFEIKNWVMSCRVFGRQLENEVMNIVVDVASNYGAKTLRADYIATQKNTVISDLYGRLAFARIDEPTQDDARSTWQLELADYSPIPTFIRHETNSQ